MSNPDDINKGFDDLLWKMFSVISFIVIIYIALKAETIASAVGYVILFGISIVFLVVKQSENEYKKFEKRELNYINDEGLNPIFYDATYTNKFAYTFIASDKKLEYINTKWSWKGEGVSNFQKIIKLSDITNGQIKIHTNYRQKVSKKSILKKSLAGSLVLGLTGAVAGALLADLYEDEFVTGYSLYIKVKNNSGYIPLFTLNGESEIKDFETYFENSNCCKWYLPLIEKDFSNLDGDT